MTMLKHFTFIIIALVPYFVVAEKTAHSDSNISPEWSTYGNGLHNQRHSLLKDINAENVHKMKLAWKYRTGKVGTFQTSPLVVDDVMYFSTPFNDVVALDAYNGSELWRYQHELTRTKTCCGPANRGVAIAGNNVYQATIDGRLIALNKENGKVVWETVIKDSSLNIQKNLSSLQTTDLTDEFSSAKMVGGTGHSFNMAPQVFNGMVFVGSTGAGYGLHLDTDKGLVVIDGGDDQTGLRGFIAAFDQETGEELWRWYSVSGEEWTGKWVETTSAGVDLNRNIALEKADADTFKSNWKLGGGSIWTTPAIDEETGLMFFGTGNPSPNMESSTRPGDNLNTCSIVALDASTGKLKWAFQQVPHDRWGYDVASPVVLIEVLHNGKKVKAVGQAGKTGWFYILDRETGELLYKSEPFVPQSNLFANPTEEGVKIYPAIDGGSNWSPVAVDPNKNNVFIAGVHLPTTYFKKILPSTPTSPWKSYTYFEMDYSSKYGLLSSIDLDTGKVNWQHKTKNPLIGGVLHTAGGLVFSGEGSGEFFALDAKSGEKRWSSKTAYGVNAPPVSYQAKGKQFVVVAAGGNKLQGYPVGDEVLVYALSEE